MKTNTQPGTKNWGFAMVEGLIALTVACFVLCALFFALPRIAIAVECLILAYLIALRARTVFTVWRMTGKVPLRVGDGWPLLGATLALAWLIGVQGAAILIAEWRSVVPKPANPPELSFLFKALTSVVASIGLWTTFLAPFAAIGFGCSVAGETSRWRQRLAPRPPVAA